MAGSGYDFYLDKCFLPVTPSKLTMKINNQNKTVTLINEGEINVLKKAGLTDIEFECEIPQVKQPYAVYPSGFKTAGYYLDYFEKLKTNKTPFQFIVCRQLPNGKKFFNTNIKVSLEDYKIVEDAKEGFDLKIKISLKQYKEYGTKTVNIRFGSSKPTANISSQRSSGKTVSAVQTYTVKKGDCLWNISQKYYGQGSSYTTIYDANKDVVGGNPNLIYPGQVLTIPVL